MKKIWVYIISALLIIFQVTLASRIKFFGLNYGLAICSVIVVSCIYDTKTAIINSLVCGIVYDTFASSHYGIYLLLFFVLAVITVLVSDFMYKGSMGASVTLTLILTFLSELLLYYIVNTYGGAEYSNKVLVGYVLPQAFLSAFVSVIVFGIFKSLYKKLKLDKQW